MKSSGYVFEWFEKEDQRRRFRASLSRGGRLRLGKSLAQALPARIRIGFDEKHTVLAIAEGHGTGIELPKCGIVSAAALSAQITASGLRLPLSFLFVRVVAYFFMQNFANRRILGIYFIISKYFNNGCINKTIIF